MLRAANRSCAEGRYVDRQAAFLFRLYVSPRPSSQLCSHSSYFPRPAFPVRPTRPSLADLGKGFAIETEMLTYKAVETNSEAVACDLAGYLYGTPIQFPEGQPASRCPLSAPAKPGVIGIVVLPFDDKLPEAFQAWPCGYDTDASHDRTVLPRAAEPVLFH